MIGCTSCGRAMVAVEFMNAEIDHCPACGGCWLDAGELGVILRREPFVFDGAGGRAARAGPRRCPRCARAMVRSLFPGTPVEIDACPAGEGLWLDRGELEAVLRARPDGAGAAAALLLREIFRTLSETTPAEA
jgi:Zn-finger nucleic acid-binding protein